MKLFRLLTILTTFLCLGLIVSCEENANNQQSRWYPPEEELEKNAVDAPAQTLWGHWVCSNYVDLVKARRTVRSINSRPMFLEVVFKPEFDDSVLLITGYTNFFAAYERVGKDSIIIKNIKAGDNLVLHAAENMTRLELLDSSQNNSETKVYAWSFTKMPKNTVAKGGKKPTTLYTRINEGILSGTYLNGDKGKVTFYNTGQISGWEGINNYSICTGGDCFLLTRSPLDIITLNGDKHYAFWIKSNDSLYLYNLEKKSSKPPYNYQPEGIAYAFKKENK